jgi:hypothetical protein
MRESGYYWVRHKKDRTRSWIIGTWVKKGYRGRMSYWKFPGVIAEWDDEDLAEIDERPIRRLTAADSTSTADSRAPQPQKDVKP